MIADTEVKRYEAVSTGSQTYIWTNPGNGTLCICVGPNHAENAAMIVQALSLLARVHGDCEHADGKC